MDQAGLRAVLTLLWDAGVRVRAAMFATDDEPSTYNHST